MSDGPTEAPDNLIKRIKRIGSGVIHFRNYRIRTLLYAGKPNGYALPTLTALKPQEPDYRMAYASRPWPECQRSRAGTSLSSRAWMPGSIRSEQGGSR